ncbi:transporter substrate-binding domain-containing protein [Saccharibacillus endophyticus]|uniref:ABC transporter substrate-binding protein n=1 Tax=Saccharibacillus endophyticus TaxID=2060666 RepID=A0ABQ1ZNB4_9BACL|nr:transporter substrate-binding domain-containing protein [Saccharibacillus endophyticus]GGH69828.1 ABC transporter substrate-binding protein [Saccharibacillus endophyticus]
MLIRGKKWESLLLTAVLAMSALTGCGGGERAEGVTGLLDNDKFVFTASGEFRPFSYLNDDLTMSGFDIEVGNAIAEELGVEPVAKRMKMVGLVEGVKNGRADAAVASLTINDLRAKHVLFSTPYYYSGPQIFTRPDSPIQTTDDLKGKEVAVAKGTSYLDIAKRYTGNVRTYDSDITALQALADGRHDAVITDFVTGRTTIQEGFAVEERQLIERSEQAVVVPMDNPALLKRINEAIDALREDGTLKQISEEYFGEDITTEPEAAAAD